jgi:hypothetical protein
MAISRFDLGSLYVNKGDILERKFLGCVLNLALQIRDGGYANPTAAQIAWKDHAFGCDLAEKTRLAREAMEWGLANNSNLQANGADLADGDLDWITAEYAKTYAG